MNFEVLNVNTGDLGYKTCFSGSHLRTYIDVDVNVEICYPVVHFRSEKNIFFI